MCVIKTRALSKMYASLLRKQIQMKCKAKKILFKKGGRYCMYHFSLYSVISITWLYSMGRITWYQKNLGNSLIWLGRIGKSKWQAVFRSLPFQPSKYPCVLFILPIENTPTFLPQGKQSRSHPLIALYHPYWEVQYIFFFVYSGL